MPLPIPQPEILGRNDTFVGLRKYQSRVGTFNRFLREHAAQLTTERELLAAKLVGRWRSGAPLTLGRPGTIWNRAQTRTGTTISPMKATQRGSTCHGPHMTRHQTRRGTRR